MTEVIFPTRSKAFSALSPPTSRRDSLLPNNQNSTLTTTSIKRIKLSNPLTSIPQIDPQTHLQHASKTLIDSLPSLLAPATSTTPPLPLQYLQSLCKLLCTPYHLPSTGNNNTIPTKALSPSQANLEALYNAARSQLEAGGKEIGRSLRSEGMGGSTTTKGKEWLKLILNRFEDWEYRSNRLISVLLYLQSAYVLPASTGTTSNPGTNGGDGSADINEIIPLKQIALNSFRDGVLLGERLVVEKANNSLGSWLVGRWVVEDAATSGKPNILSNSTSAEEDQEEESIISKFLSLMIYLKAEESFMETYVTCTHQHYTARSQTLLSRLNTIAGPGSEYTAVQYVSWIYGAMGIEEEKCLKVWKGEKRRDGLVVKGLEGEVWNKVMVGMKKEVVEKGVVNKVQQALDEILDKKDHETLKKLYRLLASIKKFSEMKKAMSQYVKTRATTLISDQSHDHEMVPNLLSLKRELESAVTALYDLADEENPLTIATVGGDAEGERRELRRRLALEGEVRDGLKAGVESRQAVPAEMIAKHLDQVMRKGQGTSTTAEFESLLDEIVDLVKFTKDKDVFKEFFTSQLAKRLLLSKSASGEEEMSMVKKLQREYGEEFTSGDAMMKDLQGSEDMNKRFTEVRLKNGKEASLLSVNVLSQGHWPPYKQLQVGWENLTLPKDMQRSLDDFAGWYNHTYSGRVLSWRHQHTSVTMLAHFPSGTKEITVSLFQALVLLQFASSSASASSITTGPEVTSNTTNDGGLTFEEILANTGIEKTELIRTLQSLYGNKQTRMLIKKPMGKDVNEGDRFVWNETFTRDRMRFKINQLQQDMSAEESKQTSLKVFEDRTMTLDAQIVRLMKSAKKMTLSELVNETVKAVEKMFVPEVKGIKAQVESLIEREYMERDENDRNMLKYLA